MGESQVNPMTPIKRLGEQRGSGMADTLCSGNNACMNKSIMAVSRNVCINKWTNMCVFVHVEGQTPVLDRRHIPCEWETDPDRGMRVREMSLTAWFDHLWVNSESPLLPKPTLFPLYLWENMCQCSSVSHLNRAVMRAVIEPKNPTKADEKGSMEPIVI